LGDRHSFCPILAIENPNRASIEHRLMVRWLPREVVEAQQFPRDRCQKATWQRHLTVFEQEIVISSTQLTEEQKVSDRDRDSSTLFHRRSN
jgi:hypothetical protein